MRLSTVIMFMRELFFGLLGVLAFLMAFTRLGSLHTYHVSTSFLPRTIRFPLNV
jgi:hypothetical protein